MELLHCFQVGLKRLDLGGKVFSNFLNRFITGEEVEKLVDLSAKDIDTSKFFN